MLNFFSVTLLHFSDQNWNSQSCLFNLHIISSLVHIIKAISHSSTYYKCFGTFMQMIMYNCLLVWSKCIILILCWIVLPPEHQGISSLHVIKCKMVEPAAIICEACEDIRRLQRLDTGRHSRSFIAREDICCDMDKNLWPDRQERQAELYMTIIVQSFYTSFPVYISNFSCVLCSAVKQSCLFLFCVTITWSVNKLQYKQ